MLTMQPSVTIGSYTWAQDRLPYDEFSLRLDDLRVRMERNGWSAVLVYGDVRDHAALAYLSNFIPRVRWGMALLPRAGEPRLLCAMSTRDLPAMRTLTWIADVRSGMGPEWEKSFDPWLERLYADGVTQIGTLGFDLVSPLLHRSVVQSLGGRIALQRADDILPMPPPHKRPRELTMLRAACKLLQTATEAFVAHWRDSGEPETAALEAERVARSLAAQDVRTLISLDGGRTLVPYQGRFEKKSGPLVGYLAVKVMGYWADTFVTVDQNRTATRHAAAAIEALIAAMRPGMRAGELHAKAIELLPPFSLHPVLGGSVGHGIGLSLNEQPEMRADADVVLVENGVYCLQAGIADAEAGNALASAMVCSTPHGVEVLARSPA